MYIFLNLCLLIYGQLKVVKYHINYIILVLIQLMLIMVQVFNLIYQILIYKFIVNNHLGYKKY
jgi:hypothetical protein